MAAAHFSHLGICVADLDRSLRFYTEALGFSLKRTIESLAEPFDTLMGLPGARLRIHQITLGPLMVELIGFAGVATEGDGAPRPMNRRGLTHLTFAVPDVEATAQAIERLGGCRLSRVDSAFGPLIFCADPDGVRLELMQPLGG